MNNITAKDRQAVQKIYEPRRAISGIPGDRYLAGEIISPGTFA